MSQTVTIPLTEPITKDGRPLDAITIRRPKSGDLRRMDRVKGGDLDKTLFLIGTLAELTPAEVDEIDAADLTAISEVIEDFTGRAG